MRRVAAILSGLLALQVVGAIALAFTGPSYDAFRPSEPLLAFDSEAVDEVAIHGEDGTALLRRGEDGWLLPDLYDFPADGDKVAKLIERLGEMKRGLPVATSASARARFKVTQEDFERRIVLSGDGEEIGEILIGTSPSYRLVHARTPADDSVYSVEFALYDAGAKPGDWTDRDFLLLDAAEVQAIKLPDFTLLRKGEGEDAGFVLDGLGEDESVDQDAVDDLADKILRLRFAGVEGRGEEALERLGEPEVTVTLTREGQDDLTLRLRKMEEGDDYLMARSDHDYLFRATKYAVSAVAEATRESLLAEEETDSSLSHKRSEKDEAGSG